MSRSRTIRPGFFRNEDLGQQPPLNRILFEGLWCESDREGRLRDSPPYLKAMILPYDNCNVDEMLDALNGAEFIKRYEVGGKKFIQVIKFHKHQRPHPKEPPSEIPPYQPDTSLCEKPRLDHGSAAAHVDPDHGSAVIGSRLNPSVSSFPSGVYEISGISLPSGDPELAAAPEVEIGEQPADQGGIETAEVPKPVKSKPSPKIDLGDPGSVRRAVAALASGSKMENAVGPGERKRQLKLADARPQRPRAP